MLNKKLVIAAVKEMPDTFDTTAIFDRLILLDKIEEGRRQIKEGKSLTTAEAKKKLKKWLS
jgi:predicted transcriptional regulator